MIQICVMNVQEMRRKEKMSEYEIEQGFEIIINREVEKRISWLTRNYENEISAWLGGEIKEDKIIIDDLLFPEQIVGGASVDTDQRQLIKLRKEYGNRCLRIVGHWHSHNNMSAHWSSDDEKFIEEHMHERELRVFFVSSVRDGIRARIELRKPLKISIDKLDLKVEYEDKELEEEMNKIIKDKVEEAKTTIYSGNWWDKEDVEEVLTAEVKVLKESNNVEIKDLRESIFTKIEDMYPLEKEVKYMTDGSVEVVYKIGDKRKARAFRDEIRQAISIMEEAEDIKEENVDSDDYYYNQEEQARLGGFGNGFY